MKTSFNSKPSEPAAVADRRQPASRSGAKTIGHRYERRKVREQLRHLDWALAGID